MKENKEGGMKAKMEEMNGNRLEKKLHRNQ